MKQKISESGHERALISICIRHPEALIECQSSEFYAEHFTSDANKYIYMATLYLYSKKQEPTPISIYGAVSDTKAKKAIDDIGGLKYLTSLSGMSESKKNALFHINKIKQAYTRNVIIGICSETIDEMEDDDAGTKNQTELISSLDKKINELSVNSNQKTEIYKMGDDTDEVLKQRAERPEIVPGLETGWTHLDRMTNGALPGDLIFVVARSKTGKSVTLTNWAIQQGINDGLPVLYIDTEMSSREQEDRILSNLTGIPHSEIVSGAYVLDTINGKAVEKIEKLNIARDKLKAGKYYHYFMPQFTIEKVTSIAKQFKMQHNIVALYFDYLKIPSNQASTLKSVQEYQMLGFMATGLKELAGILKIPIYSAAQENRSTVGGEKSELSVGGSDRILQLASKLIFLYNKSDEEIARYGDHNGNQWMYIAFQRNGQSDCPKIPIMFHKTTLKQEEAGEPV